MHRIARKLIINRETVRQLTGLNLAAVHGGQSQLPTCSMCREGCQEPVVSAQTQDVSCDSLAFTCYNTCTA